MPTETHKLLRHFIATLAYRGRNVLKGMPPEISCTRFFPGIRTSLEILVHMLDVLSCARICFVPDEKTPSTDLCWEDAVTAYFDILREIDDLLKSQCDIIDASEEQLLQGPFADAMLHLGQIGILRRAGGSPVSAEDYMLAHVDAGAFSTSE